MICFAKIRKLNWKKIIFDYMERYNIFLDGKKQSCIILVIF